MPVCFAKFVTISTFMYVTKAIIFKNNQFECFNQTIILCKMFFFVAVNYIEDLSTICLVGYNA